MPSGARSALIEVVVPREARHLLDDEAGEGGAVVRVRRDLPHRPDAGGQAVVQELRQGPDGIGRAREQTDRSVLEARRVGHEVGHRHRLRVGVRHPQRAQVRVDVGVQVEGALLDELHHRGPDEELGDRSDAKQRAIGVDGRPRLEIGVAVPPAERRLAGLDDHDDGAHEVARFELRRHLAVDERLERGGVGRGRDAARQHEREEQEHAKTRR
jgi:hypothetical protein